MIVQLAGLPGTGKSSLAAELVHRLEGRTLLLDKDRVRHALFGLQHALYTREQDDFCVITLFRIAAWHLRQLPVSVVILDGRTCSHAYQVTQVRRFATRARQPLRIIECATRALFYLHHPLHTDPDPVNATARPPSRQATT